MEKIQNLGDKRQTMFCVYCGGLTETKEHVPSRIFLDKPYPDGLSTVGACLQCNQGYSLDEEYVACLIECARVGSVDSKSIQREKIRRALSNKQSLVKKLRGEMSVVKGEVSFSFNLERFRKVLVKLASGHMLFDQNEPLQGSPSTFNFGTLDSLSEDSRMFFEEPPGLVLLPEVGSRAMQRILVSEKRGRATWVEVQRDRYRYLAVGNGVVRMVFSEYMWCEIGWQD